MLESRTGVLVKFEVEQVVRTRATNRVLGDYYDSEGRLDLWGARPAIWVPPEVEVVRAPFGDALCYPMGVQWPETVRESGDPLGVLQKYRWRVRDDASGVIEELIALAHDPSVPRAVRFARKWGPIWKCYNPGHGECLWSRTWMAHPSRTRCVWSNVEPVKLFMTEASRVEAIVLAFGKLREGKGVPGDVWGRIAWAGLSDPRNASLPLGRQRWMLAAIISQRLELLPGAPVLSLRWRDRRAMTLEVASGWGFIRAAWLQVAQLVTGVKSLYICDGCGSPYARERKAKTGQHQFCSRCRKGNRAAKRLWWDEHRGRERRASVIT